MQDINTEINQYVQEHASECDIEVRGYSSRGYGARECLGLVGEISTLRDFISVMSTELTNEHVGDVIDACGNEDFGAECDHRDRIRELVETFVGYHEDSMGLSRIFYFPNIQFQEPEDQ